MVSFDDEQKQEPSSTMVTDHPRKTLEFSQSTISTASLSTDDGLEEQDSFTGVPSQFAPKKTGGVMKIRRQSQSLREEYHSAQSQSQEHSDRSVGFESLQIHEFERELGDNPAVTAGPPLTIKWEATKNTTMKVDEFEEQHPPRRSTVVLKVPTSMREQWLREEGVGSTEFQVAAKEAAEIRKSRAENAEEPKSDLKKLIEESKRKKKEAKQNKQKQNGLTRFLTPRVSLRNLKR